MIEDIEKTVEESLRPMQKGNQKEGYQGFGEWDK